MLENDKPDLKHASQQSQGVIWYKEGNKCEITLV